MLGLFSVDTAAGPGKVEASKHIRGFAPSWRRVSFEPPRLKRTVQERVRGTERHDRFGASRGAAAPPTARSFPPSLDQRRRVMPETYGKRQRRDVRARKIAAREERRVARNVRRELRATGEVEPGSPIEGDVEADLEAPEEVPEQAAEEGPAPAKEALLAARPV